MIDGYQKILFPRVQEYAYAAIADSENGDDKYWLMSWDILYTSTAALPMRYTNMGYSSMRYTFTALHFYEENTQTTNKFF